MEVRKLSWDCKRLGTYVAVGFLQQFAVVKEYDSTFVAYIQDSGICTKKLGISETRQNAEKYCDVENAKDVFEGKEQLNKWIIN